MHSFVAKLLSNAVMTYICVQSPQEPTSDDMANLLRTQRMHFSMRRQHLRMTTPLSFEISFLKSLSYMTAAIGLVYFLLLARYVPNVA